MSPVAKSIQTHVIAPSRAQVIAALPSHMREDGDAFLTAFITQVAQNQALTRAAMQNAAGLMATVQEAARLGLVPGSPDYYLVPRGNQVTGMVSYRGEMELMRRTGRVRDFGHMLVRDNDRFEWRGVTELPLLQEAPEGERGELRCAIAWAEYRDGTRSSIVRVDRDRIAAAKKASGSARSASSPWVQHEAAMWRKTAFHELSLIVGTSVEERRPEALAAAAEREALHMERDRLEVERMQAENERLRLQVELARLKASEN
nr:MAG TPA: RecT protein [Caudoviricetes sp.]